MNRLTTALAAGLATTLITTPLFAQQKVSSECRSEVIKLCGMDRSKIRGCLRESIGQLSEPCQQEVRAVAKAREEKKKSS